MRKLFVLATALIITALAAVSAFAKPEATEYRADGFSSSQLKTVLVMPLIYETKIPSSEAFLDETLQKKWRDMTTGRKGVFPFVMKTPGEVVERAAFVSGQPAPAATPQQQAEKALTLAAEYTDAILMCSVTKAGNTVIAHPGEYYTAWRTEQRPVWRNNRWEKEDVRIPYQAYKEPWDEHFTQGAVKIELRSSKDNALLYGVNVTANTGEGIFSDAPTLSKHLQNVIENAAKRIPTK